MCVCPHNLFLPPSPRRHHQADEDMLATIIGHECAHALARHSSEKISLGLFIALAVQVGTSYLQQLASYIMIVQPVLQMGRGWWYWGYTALEGPAGVLKLSNAMM
jgi:Zn-dependent protease with chaperone function